MLIAATIALAGAARTTGIGTTRIATSTAVESRDLRFTDQHDGSILVVDAVADQTVAVIRPGTNGFIRGALRGLSRERKQQGIGAGPAFRLVRWADGRLTIEDTVTSRVIDLAAFGPTNSGAFAELLDGNGTRQ